MNKNAAFVLVALTAIGCSSAVSPTRTATRVPQATVAAEARMGADPAAPQAALPAAPKAKADARQVGDFVVYAFDGTYRKGVLELTGKVLARTATEITVEWSLSEKGQPTDSLRVMTSLAGARSGEVIWVAKKNKFGEFETTSKKAYDALLEKTVATADDNDDLLSTDETTVKVGATEVKAQRTTYKVKIGKTPATMQTISSDAFAWGDVGGEIRTTDGTIFYRAKVTGAGTAAKSTVASLEDASY